MILIASVDKNWGIGYEGQLLAKIPEDLKRFKALTTGNTIIYGRRTLETFPHAQPLPDRQNILITTNSNIGIYAKNLIVVHSIEELCNVPQTSESGDLFVVGGESVYKQLIEFCDVAYITYIDKEFTADAHLPNLDANGSWRLVEFDDLREYKDLKYRFMTYKRM